MGSRNTLGPLKPKTWQLDQDQSSAQGYLYSCSLCDENLVLSKLFINPRKVQLVFLDICPGCGFELEKPSRSSRQLFHRENGFLRI